MKLRHSTLFIIIGSMHSLLAVLPIAFGKQFNEFAQSAFFKVSDGLSEFPLLNGQMNYENFAAFWFFYYGLLLIPLGLLVRSLERSNIPLSPYFTICYTFIVLIGVYMIPFSGMTFIMLPHALFMLIQSLKQQRYEQ